MITYIVGLPKLQMLQIKLKSGSLENPIPGGSTQYFFLKVTLTKLQC